MSNETKTRIEHSATGKVVSNKMDKTVTVRLERNLKHPLYGKYIRRSSKVHAHDETNDCNEGDTVRIVPDRPLSKTKSWKVVEVVERAQ
ncbi:MAG TPA: 30S ribosomal protein S17 [Wenzhouxiangellaceae bacterium]|nr:30S ribosomal protein S17 [Wenzhouxiangellaceae bacterium]